MKLKIDKELCIACEACVNLCPKVFAMNDESTKAYVKQDANYDSCDSDEAIDICPVEAISKEE